MINLGVNLQTIFFFLSMAEQRKILRIFKLISLLKGVRRRRPEQLADILEISKRTVYRYFILLEELGFVIDVDFEGHHIRNSNIFKRHN